MRSTFRSGFIPQPLTRLRSIYAIALCLFLGTVAHAQGLPSAQILELGKPIERELKGGEVHSYTIPLKASQLIELVVDQRGIDVVAKLIGPDGQQLAEVDSPNGTNGPEPITDIVEVAGNYQLQISSLEKDAPKGRYEAKLVDVREATKAVRDGFAARALVAEAKELAANRRTAESDAQIVQKYQGAIQKFQSAGDSTGELAALRGLAYALSGMGKHPVALEYSNQALSLARSRADQNSEYDSLMAIGEIYSAIPDHERALENFERARTLSRSLKDRSKEAWATNFIGLQFLSLGDRQRALDRFNEVLAIYTELNQMGKVAVALLNLGAVFSELGDIPRAIEFLERAAKTWHQQGSSSDETLALYNLGTIYLIRVGDYEKALQTFLPIPERARREGSRDIEMNAYTALFLTYTWLKKWDEALGYFNKALPMSREMGNRRMEAILLTNLGEYHAGRGENKEAIDVFTKALAIHREVRDPTQESGTMALMAAAELARGNYNEARTNIESTLVITEAHRSNLLDGRLRSSYFTRLHRHYGTYIDILMRMHNQDPAAGYDLKALSASERARARTLLESLIETKADIRKGLDPELIERERLAREKFNAKATEQIRGLGNAQSPEQAAAAKAAVSEAELELQRIETLIRQKSPRYGALVHPQPLTPQQIQREFLDNDTVLLEYSLGEKNSYLWFVTQTSVQSFVLPPAPEIKKEARRVIELLSDGRRWSSDQKMHAEYNAAALPLSKVLLPQSLISQLKGKRLAIVSDGILQYLAFGSLPVVSSQGTLQPLVVENEIINLPSASTLAVLRRETGNRLPAPKAVAVFADPVFTEDDPRVAAKLKVAGMSVQPRKYPSSSRATVNRALNWRSESDKNFSVSRLPFTRREADDILSSAKAGTSLKVVDFSASREAALSGSLSDFQIVHFATHGILNTDHADLSGIVLSLVDEKGEQVNGFLRLNEIYEMKLNSDLVVLSACQTALGKDVRGEGLIGLTRGFMYAGSPRVIASLWKVDDVATAELMKIFYQKLLKEKMRPAAALREAKIAMMKQKRWSLPYYWAAFELQGEWR